MLHRPHMTSGVRCKLPLRITHLCIVIVYMCTHKQQSHSMPLVQLGSPMSAYSPCNVNYAKSSLTTSKQYFDHSTTSSLSPVTRQSSAPPTSTVRTPWSNTWGQLWEGVPDTDNRDPTGGSTADANGSSSHNNNHK
jgi:hypothetical protein